MHADATRSPRIADDVAWVVVDGDVVALGPSGLEVHLMRGTGAILWQLFDGRATVEEIGREIADAFDLPIERAMKDVTDFASSAEAVGLVRSTR